MIYDIIAACISGYDLLICYLSMMGYSLAEIAQETGDSKTSVFRRLRQIKERMY